MERRNGGGFQREEVTNFQAEREHKRKEDINLPHRDEGRDFTLPEENPPSSTICRVVRLKPVMARKRMPKAKERKVSPSVGSKANTESKGKKSVPRRGKMDTENQERGEQCKQTPGDVGNTTKTKQTKFDLTAVRHLLLEGLVRSLLPVRGGYNSRATRLSPEGP